MKHTKIGDPQIAQIYADSDLSIRRKGNQVDREMVLALLV
jgi:hypothetical protein